MRRKTIPRKTSDDIMIATKGKHQHRAETLLTEDEIMGFLVKYIRTKQNPAGETDFGRAPSSHFLR